jgi:hypothetical protein
MSLNLPRRTANNARKDAKNGAKRQRRNDGAEVRHLMDLFEG